MGFFKNVRSAGRRFFADVGLVQAAPTSVSSTEMGRAGTQSFHGIIAEDFNQDFQGQRAITIYNKMRRTDGMINAILSALKLPIMAAERTIESADVNDAKQKEIADFVRKALFENMESGFDNFLREALNYLDFGFYYFEKVYKIEKGMVMVKKLAPRLPSAHYLWVQQGKETEPGVTQMLKALDPTIATMTPTIPMSKLVLLTNNKEGDNYEGTSVLRTSYKDWFYKDTLNRINGIRFERGAGVLKIILPEGAGDEAQADAEELGENFKLGEAAYIVQPDPKWTVELMTAGIADQKIEESFQRHNREIAVNILAQFLDLGSSGKGGSFALSKDQSSFFGLSLRAIAKNVENAINEQLIKELVKLNYGEQEEYPKLCFGEIGEVDYATMSTALGTLVTNGLLDSSPDVRVWVRKTFGLPEVTVEDLEAQDAENAAKAAAMVDPNAPANDPNAKPVAGNEKKPVAPPQKKVDNQRSADDVNDVADEGDGIPVTPIKPSMYADKRFFRDLTLAENRVKLGELGIFFADLEDTTQSDLQDGSKQQKDGLMKQIEKIIDGKDIAAIAALALIANSALNDTVREIAKQAMEEGKRTAANEIGSSLPTTSTMTKKILNLKTDLAMEERSNEILEAMKKKVVSAVQNDVGKSQAMFDISKTYDDITNAWNQRIAGQVVVDSVDMGRLSVFEVNRDSIHALQRSEVLDPVTCPMCLSLDGRVIDPMDPFGKLGQVHTNCRGIWVAILKTDTELPKIKPIPKSLLNRFDTMDGVPETNKFVQLKKPKIGKTSRAAQAQDDGILEA